MAALQELAPYTLIDKRQVEVALRVLGLLVVEYQTQGDLRDKAALLQ